METSRKQRNKGQKKNICALTVSKRHSPPKSAFSTTPTVRLTGEMQGMLDFVEEEAPWRVCL